MRAIAWRHKRNQHVVFNYDETTTGGLVTRKRSTKKFSEELNEYITEKKDVSLPAPKVIKTLFTWFPKVDVHDHLRQGFLAFHETWSTLNWWHRLYSNILGIIITDAYYI